MISFLLTSLLRIFRTFEFFSGKTNIGRVLRKKNLLFLLPVNLIVFGCCSCASTSPADFGCKCAAIYGNYDFCVRQIKESLNDPAIRAKLEETPEQAAYYHQMLAVAELHRGNIPEAMNSFERSIQFKPRPIVFFFRAGHFLRERKNEKAARDIEAMEKLLESGAEAWNINYYEFLLSKHPSEAHDKILKMSQQEHSMTRLAWLKKELERNRKLPPDCLPVWAGIESGKWKQTSYGMTTEQLQALLGKPDWSYQLRDTSDSMAGLTAWCYPIPQEKKIVEFLVSEQSKRVGDIRLYDAAQYRRQDGKRQGATWFRPKDAPYVIGTAEAPQ